MREIARQFQGFDLQSKEGDGNSKKELLVLPTPLNRHAENPALGDVTAKPRFALISEVATRGGIFRLASDMPFRYG